MKTPDATNSQISQSITTLAQLKAVYGEPVQRSLIKEVDYLSGHYQSFIAHSPFLLMASSGVEGLDCSPRGDQPGFVQVVDKKTLLIPDRRGNNRVDTLGNLIQDSRVSLLFLIPGVGETLRVKGTAEILIAPDLCARFSVNGKLPRSVLRISVQKVYFQCQKALVRSKLWQPESIVPRQKLPSAGEILEALSAEPFDGKSFDEDYPDHMLKTLY